MRNASIPAALGVYVLLLAGPGPVSAQNLNTREAAPPSANAKTGRVLSKARSKSAEAGSANLNRETVNTDCSPVQIGAKESSNERGLSKRKIDRDEQFVVVPGDVINICR